VSGALPYTTPILFKECRMQWFSRTLAAGYAESGQFSEAIDIAQQAFQLAIAQGNSTLAQDLQLNIANYRRELPFRDPGLTTAGPSR
jgi:hypothetical protein